MKSTHYALRKARLRLGDTIVLAAAMVILATGGNGSLFGQTPVTAPINSTPADPFNQVHQAQVSNGTITYQAVNPIPPTASSFAAFPPKTVTDPASPLAVSNIHPLVAQFVAQYPAQSLVTVVVNFVDDVTIPRFPEAAAGPNAASAAQLSGPVVAAIQQQRAPEYAALQQQLAQQYGAQVLDQFWLIKGMVVSLPVGNITALAARPDVLYVEPENAGDPPPVGTVSKARAIVNSDVYFNLGDTRGFIGLLDTGLRSTHTLLTSTIFGRFNCTTAVGVDCANTTVTNDDCWNHGTSSAAILTGNNNLGDLYRGVTANLVHSYRVYPTSAAGACEGLSVTAAVRGFEYAVFLGDRVIVAEMQGSGGITSAIPTAANKAFDAGAVIIAANGNAGPGAGTVRAPANAHRVIGVGDFDVDTQAQIASQGEGPTSDGRYKPDVQTPTNTETASNASDTALRIFTGTSGSTPYAGGVASLFRNWLRGTSASIDPGQVYAQMILAGQRPWPAFNNTTGAGPAQMGTGGIVYWGKVSVTNGQTIDVPLAIAANMIVLVDGSLWWPESPGKPHNDVDLYLLDSNGVVQAASLSGPSVFERARILSQLPGGNWKLRIRGNNVPNGPQTVYFAARAVTQN